MEWLNNPVNYIQDDKSSQEDKSSRIGWGCLIDLCSDLCFIQACWAVSGN